jgi:hypothetical protein
MTFGDVKAEALRLMGLDEPVNADNVGDYEEDENWAPLIRMMWSAINRCFADLETKRVLPLRRKALADPTGRVSWRLFYYGGDPGVMEVARLVVESDGYVDTDRPFLLDEVGYLRVMDYDASADYAILYRPRMARLSSVSGDDTDIDLPAELCEALPWFVKSEVYRLDEPAEAAEARNFYENAVEQYAALAEVSRQGTVQSVYGMDLT